MYASKGEIARAREVDLLTYLQCREPGNLVHVGGNVYCTAQHDSLKISNGKWMWWSRGFGGNTALDYLVQAEGLSLPQAVAQINGVAPRGERQVPRAPPTPSPFKLPPAHTDHRRVFAYLRSRGLDPELINHCFKHGLLYEEAEHHNAVFVGMDGGGIPRYAMMRGTLSSSAFLRDVEGSDKRHCFCLRASGDSNAVFVFESAIDALSHATLDKRAGRDWRGRTYLSLGGISKGSVNHAPKLPAALGQYLKERPDTTDVALCLDADEAGRAASKTIAGLLPGLTVWDRPPRRGKDYNELLQLTVGVVGKVKTRGHPDEKER